MLFQKCKHRKSKYTVLLVGGLDPRVAYTQHIHQKAITLAFFLILSSSYPR